MKGRDLFFVKTWGKVSIVSSLFSAQHLRNPQCAWDLGDRPAPAPPPFLLPLPTFLSCPPAPMPSGGSAGGRARWNGSDCDGRQR